MVSEEFHTHVVVENERLLSLGPLLSIKRPASQELGITREDLIGPRMHGNLFQSKDHMPTKRPTIVLMVYSEDFSQCGTHMIER